MKNLTAIFLDKFFFKKLRNLDGSEITGEQKAFVDSLQKLVNTVVEKEKTSKGSTIMKMIKGYNRIRPSATFFKKFRKNSKSNNK